MATRGGDSEAGRVLRAQATDAAVLLAGLGAAVRRRRLSLGLTQHRLCGAAGVDRKTVNNVENGRHAVDVVGLVRLAETLRIPPESLVRSATDALRPSGGS